MEGLEILQEIKNVEEEIGFQNYQIDALKNLKETSQVFLRVNNFSLGEEPDFREYTEDQFIEYFETNTNSEILEKFDQLNIRQEFRSNMSQVYKSNTNNSKILIYFLPSAQKKAGVDTVKSFCKLVVLLGCNEGVIISETELTTKAMEELDCSNVSSTKAEGETIYNSISYVDDAFINIVDHCLSPKVLKIYSGSELEEFLKKNNLMGKELPRILVNDPVSKFYRAKIGDVSMMERKTGIKDSIINQQLTYRMVVHSVSKQKK